MTLSSNVSINSHIVDVMDIIVGSKNSSYSWYSANSFYKPIKSKSLIITSTFGMRILKDVSSI